MKKSDTQKQAARRRRLVLAVRGFLKNKKPNAAIIVAAGNSTRMNGVDKQTVEIAGMPVLARSVAAFEQTDGIDYVVVVTREDAIDDCRRMIDSYGFGKVSAVIAGGATRQESVLRGIEALDGDTGYVAIHDGARCLVTPEMIKNVLEAARLSGAASAGTPVKDTIKQVNFTGIIEDTPDRNKLWAAQTPQIFKTDLYRAAAYYAEKEGAAVTDDNSILERLGGKVTMIDCGYTNIKITTPEDVAIAEAILRFRETENESEDAEK